MGVGYTPHHGANSDSCRLPSTCLGLPQLFGSLDRLDEHRLRVAIDHFATLRIKELILHTHIALTLAAFDHIHLAGVVRIEDGHAVNGR